MREGAGGERERAQHYGKGHQPTSVRTHPHALSLLAHCGGGTLTDRTGAALRGTVRGG